jgi:predicted porin
MKSPFVALAALATTAVFAQSSVTISGIADVGLTYDTARSGAPGVGLSPGNNKFQLAAGAQNRITFSGTEDLGGGMVATFAFQMRLDPVYGTELGGLSLVGYNTTAAGTPVDTVRPLFQGESTVGLRGRFGSIKMGRLQTAVQEPNFVMIDPWALSTVAASVYARGFASDYVRGGEGRVGNAALYSSPSLGGFSANVSVGFLKGPTGLQHRGLAALYSNGPLNAMLGHERNRFGDTLLQLGGNYDFGSAKLYLGYGNIKGGTAAERAGNTFLATAAGAQVAVGGSIKDWTIGASIPVGASTIRLGYSRWNDNGAVGKQNETKLGVGVKYALSKRTSIYSDLASLSRKNAALSGQTLFDLGIQHVF